ncbi:MULTISPECIES: AbfB domain-containing protein [unclassified Nocardia]|uniref:AbfB domain-containing protein n=1 Tax=unclassified Nocardia TaxID=2637762 RepID=UPI0033A6CD6E
MAIRLQSFNFPKFFVRHQNFEGELMELNSPGFADDFAWEEEFLRKDGDGFSIVRFRSKNFPDKFLRHSDFRIVLTADDGSQLFRNDSSFRRRNGLSGDPEQGWRSYESVNFPGRFIRHRNFHVFVDDKAPKLAADATFKRVDV